MIPRQRDPAVSTISGVPLQVLLNSFPPSDPVGTVPDPCPALSVGHRDLTGVTNPSYDLEPSYPLIVYIIFRPWSFAILQEHFQRNAAECAPQS